MPVAVALAVLVDWAVFLLLFARGFIGGFGTHYVTTPLANWFLGGSVVLELGVRGCKPENRSQELSTKN